MGLATLALSQDEPQKAEEQIRQALELKPEDQFSRRFLGIAFYNQGKNAEAMQVLEKLVSDEPEDDGAHYYLAFLYRDAGRYADAAKEIKSYQGLTGSKKMDGMIACWSRATGSPISSSSRTCR